MNSAEVKKKFGEWQQDKNVEKLWSGDASLWTNENESSWLGWLNIVDQQLNQLNKFEKLVQDIKQAEFKHVLLIGMGGSSLGPSVLASTFGKIEGFPIFHMLDSTVPEQIQSTENRIDIAQTLFIVSSKSGTTLEPNILHDYFFDKAIKELGKEKASKHFVAVTDPGSHLDKIAQQEGFRHIYYGLPSIGGRYSVLSDFGMIPAAVMGLDLQKLLSNAKNMAESCKSNNLEANPGASLGIKLGLWSNEHKDKVTFIVSPIIAELGAWLEQLLAESTGKLGKGIIPVDKENLIDSAMYGQDRVFVYLRFKSTPDQNQDKHVDQLEKNGFPVIRIELNDKYDLAGEFFRFEFATAVAGSVMEINPFNQPDVEASKIKTRAITDEYEKSGKLKVQAPVLSLNEKVAVDIYTDEANWKRIGEKEGQINDLAELLDSFLSGNKAGDYIALLAYIEMNEKNEKALQTMRSLIHNHFKRATCLGFGPRFLHSTGQVYKGGPNTGIFIEISADDVVDLPVPNKKYTFEVVKNAQAIGDFQVLCERERRAIRLHFKGKISEGLSAMEKALKDICLVKQ